MIVVNLFGGPGCGKSTAAAYIFSRLKQTGYNVELVTEFAKDLTWEENLSTLSDQIYVFGNQQHRLARLKDKVDIVITDSPILLSIIYNKINNQYLDQLCTATFLEYDNLNFKIDRVKKYYQIGRNQTEEESRDIDIQIHNLLNLLNIKFENIEGTESGYETVVKMVEEYYENNSKSR